jgi:hypothetical protein
MVVDLARLVMHPVALLVSFVVGFAIGWALALAVR